MKFPLSWIKDYVDITISTDELVHKLTMAGLEVESVDYVGDSIKGIITGKIESIEKHPNADKLVITSIFDGKQHHQIVTGASNISEGDIVPVALPGSTIASGMTLKAAKLRGIDSFGMLCSEKELGVSEEASGIWILDPNTPLGVDFSDYALLKDAVLDIAILPNRGDCQSIYGLAREIAALTHQNLCLPELDISLSKLNHDFSLTVKATDLCPIYSGRYISNITNGASPLLMKRRLELAGIRCISLIVDVTNYVLIELGQPLHAFDTSKLASTSFVVDTAKTVKTLQTLDEQERSISDDMLLIFNEDPVAIAGVMGAKNTDVELNTHSIFLESAFFDARHVRKNSTSLGLRTESSIRFEKGINIDFVETSSLRACHLLQKYGNAKIAEKSLLKKQNSDKRFISKSIPYDTKKLNSFLGSQFKDTDIENVLIKLGFQFDQKKETLSVPIWRSNDIQEWPCIAEEVARVMGFDMIPSTLPASFTIQDAVTKSDLMISTIKSFFVHNGFLETCTYPMISEDEFSDISLQQPTHDQALANPISPQLAFMRPTMLASLTKIVSYHALRQMPDNHFFEIGKTFSTDGAESLYLAGVTTGHIFKNNYTPEHKTLTDERFTFVKGLFENLFSQLNLHLELSQNEPQSWFHPTQWVSLMLGKKNVGSINLIHPTYLKQHNISNDVVYFELNLTDLFSLSQPPVTYKPFSRYPSTRRDVAFILDKKISFSSIENLIKQYRHKTLQTYFLFDHFESEQLGKDKKSMAIGFIYQDEKGTLSDDKVTKCHDKLCQRLVNELNINIR
ncbi:MAG: phenylalanine--tRNA ligase subunit beta [Rickettsiales bacterium]|nr:phenylalanine--tRNA ligase subunit beta [Rickettsiales bacterium]|tara:strand:- start:3285 stop:5666 length:2382 start_codon:yes stop_codon:yes gene_type:complete